jgi:transcription elongation GreA/GreB family factor
MALADRESTQASIQSAINRNAALLGYARSLEKERRQLMPTTAEIAMSSELNEERYFVILMAYDNAQARAKDQKPKPLWITRLSVRSPGNNFAEALPTMAKVGADLFGQQHDDLVRVRTPTQRGSVKLGELEVLGTANEKAAPAKKDK